MAKTTMNQCKNDKADCFANNGGICMALSDTVLVYPNGKKRKCPFYKTKEKRKEELQYDI